MGVRERKDREKEQRRADILDSARRVFIEYGLEHASMDRIASEAELAKGTLYLYYKNRDELLTALICNEFERLIDAMEDVLDSYEPPDKKLLRAVATFYRFSHENELFFKIITQLNVRQLFGCEPGAEGDPAQHFRQTNLRMMSAMQRLIQEGVDKGLYHLEQPVEYVVLQFIIVMKGIMVITQNNMLPPEWIKMDAEQLLVNTARMLIRGMSNSNQNLRDVK